MGHAGNEIPKAATGDGRRSLFAREVERLMDRLYGTALRLTRDPDEAQDVVAEAVQRAWEKLDQLHDSERLEGWLFQILNNTFISACRRRRSRQDLETELPIGDCDASQRLEFSLFERLHQPFLLWWSTPEQAFINDLLHADIRKAVDALPEPYRLVLVLVEIEGQRYEEAARLLDIPVGTVRSRLSRARGRLQKALWDQAREAGLPGAARRDLEPGRGGER